jgi:hypothetical protein
LLTVLFLHGVMVAQRALNSLALVRFQMGVPNKNILRQFDSDSMRDAACIASSVFLFGSYNRRKK